MLPFAKYENQRFANVHSVFPPLIGSHRKFKAADSPNKQIQNKKQPSPIRSGEEEEADFLIRMRKARQIILSHQKSKNFYLKRNIRQIQRSKTDNCQKIISRSDEKGNFSQVIYKIGNGQKNHHKKQSYDTQRFNDKILRQCKSQFMPNQQRKGKLFFNIPRRQHTQRSELRPPKSTILDQNNQRNDYSKSTNKLNIESSEQKLMEYLFPQEIMKSNGQLLIQKLKKCREDKQNPETASNNKMKSDKNNQEEQSQQSKEKSLKFPFGQKKSNRTKFLCSKKERKHIKLRFGNSDSRSKIRQSSQQLSLEELTQQNKQLADGANKEQNKQGINQKSMQLKAKKQQIKAQSKSVHFDENFKLDGWNSNQKLSTEYEVF